MEVEPRITKQYKCLHHCCYKNYQGKGMEGGKKSGVHFCLLFFWGGGGGGADQKIMISGGGKKLGGHPNPIAQPTSYCLLPNTF